MITTLTILAVLSSSLSEPSLEVWIGSNEAQKSTKLVSWERLAPIDLIGCSATDTALHSIETQAAQFKEFENAFNSKGATKVLRGLIAAEACRHQPEADSSKVAALMLRSLSNAISEGNQALANELRTKLLHHFPMIEPTLDKFPPKTVASWQQARAAVQAPMRQIEVWTSEKGTLETDGKTLTSVLPGLNRLTVPSELRRVWVKTTSHSSLIRYLPAQGAATSVLLFLPALEAGLFRGNPERAFSVCEEACPQIMQLLSNRLKRPFRVSDGAGNDKDYLPGIPMSDHIKLLEAERSQPSPSELRVLDFAPLGIAQFAQDRPTSGTLWAVSQLSFAALSLWQYQKVDNLELTTEARNDAKLWTNVFAASFYAAVVGALGDALLWRIGQQTDPSD